MAVSGTGAAADAKAADATSKKVVSLGELRSFGNGDAAVRGWLIASKDLDEVAARRAVRASMRLETAFDDAAYDRVMKRRKALGGGGTLFIELTVEGRKGRR